MVKGSKMNNKTDKCNSTLYTTEGCASEVKSKADKQVKDPENGKATLDKLLSAANSGGKAE
jgi:hypothetical protein